MKGKPEHLRAIKQYLLGELDSESRERLEEKLMTDDVRFEELLIAEDELIDEYLTDSLTLSECEHFLQYFLSTPERQQKLRFAKALRRYTAAATATESPDSAISTPPAIPPTKSILPFLRAWRPLPQFALATAFILVVAGVFFLVINTKNPTSIPSEVASNKGQPPPSIFVTLTPGLVRDAGELKRVPVPVGSDATLQVSLKLDTNGYADYRAILKTKNRQIALLDNLDPQSTEGSKIVVFNLPASLLVRGDYQIKLEGKTPGGDFDRVGSYSFRVIQP